MSDPGEVLANPMHKLQRFRKRKKKKKVGVLSNLPANVPQSNAPLEHPPPKPFKKRKQFDSANPSSRKAAENDLDFTEHLFAKCVLVPWTCREEWLAVYEQVADILLQADNEAALLQFDLDQLSAVFYSVWRTSWHELDDCVESTVLVLRSLRALYQKEPTASLSGSMAVIRFVKSVTENFARRKFHSIQWICQQLGVPEWLVRIRHDLSHSTLREREEILEALLFAAKWLKEHYWDVAAVRINTSGYMEREKDTEGDFPNPEEAQDVIEQELYELLPVMEKMQKWKLYRWDRGSEAVIRKRRRRRLVYAAELQCDLNYYLRHYLPSFARALVGVVLCPAHRETLPTDLRLNRAKKPNPTVSPEDAMRCSPLVQLVLDYPGGTHELLLSLAALLGDPSDLRAGAAFAWINWVLQAIPRNRRGSLRLWDAFDLMVIAKAVVAKQSRYSEDILKVLTGWVSNKKEHHFVTQCRQLAAAVATKHPPVTRPSAPEKAKPKRLLRTANMLKTELKDKYAINLDENAHNQGTAAARWEQADDINWKGVPIGVLPWQKKPHTNLYQELLVTDQ